MEIHVRLIYNRDDFEKKRLQLYRVLSCRTTLWHVSVILVDAFPTLEQNSCWKSVGDRNRPNDFSSEPERRSLLSARTMVA